MSNVHRVYGDEPVLIYSSQNYEGLPTQNGAIVALYNIGYKLIGFGNQNAIKINLFFSVLSFIIFFNLINLIFKNKPAAYWSVILLMITKSNLGLATSSYTTTISVFLGLTSFFLFNRFLKHGNVSLNLCFLISLALQLNTREEYIVFVPIFFFSWLFLKRKKIKKKEFRYWLVNLLSWLVIIPFSLFSFSIPLIQTKLQFFRGRPDMSVEGSQLIVHFMNMLENLSRVDKLLFVILIISGLLSLKILKKEKRDYMSIFLITGLIFMTIYNIVSYFTWWFALIIYAFVVPSLGIVISHIIKKASNKKLRISFKIFIIIFIIVYTSNNIAVINTINYTVGHTYLSTIAPQIVNENIDQNCLIISPYAANMEMGANQKIISVDRFLQHESIIELYNCTYLFEDWLCQKEDENKEDCDYIKDKYIKGPEIKMIDEKHGYNYSLYNFNYTGLLYTIKI